MAEWRHQVGAAGEELARQYLRRSGYQIIELNYRCCLGEIDIVARDGPLLVFVEVRTRTGTRFGSAVESINAAKKARLSRLAQYYLKQELNREVPCRFDLIAIDMGGRLTSPRINHLKGII